MQIEEQKLNPKQTMPTRKTPSAAQIMRIFRYKSKKIRRSYNHRQRDPKKTMPSGKIPSIFRYKSKKSWRRYNHRRRGPKTMLTGKTPPAAQIRQILRNLFKPRQLGTSRQNVHISISTYPSTPEPSDYPSSPPSPQPERVHGPEPRLRCESFICGPDSEPDSLNISPISIDASSSGVSSPVSPLSPLERSPASKAKIRRMLIGIINPRRLGRCHQNNHISISQSDGKPSSSNHSQVCDKEYLNPPPPVPPNERVHGPEPQFPRMPFCGPDSESNSPTVSLISCDGPTPSRRPPVSPLSHLKRLAASLRKQSRIPPHPHLSPSAASTMAILNLPLLPSPSRKLSLASSTGSQVSFVSALEYPAVPTPQFAAKESRCFPRPEVRLSAAASSTATLESPLPSSSDLIPSLNPSTRPSAIPSSPIQRPAVPSLQPAVRNLNCFPNPYSVPCSTASIKTIWTFPPPSRRASQEASLDVRPSSGESAASQRPINKSPMRPPLPSVRPAASGPDFTMQESRVANLRLNASAATTRAISGYPLEQWPRRGSSLEHFSGTSPISDAPAPHTRFPVIPASPIIRPSAPSPDSAMRGYRLPRPRLSVSAASTIGISHSPLSPSSNLNTISSTPVTPPPPSTPQPPHATIFLFVLHNNTHRLISVTLPISLQRLWGLALKALGLWDGMERVRRGRMMVSWCGRGLYGDELPERTVITENNMGWVLGVIRERRRLDVMEVVLF